MVDIFSKGGVTKKDIVEIAWRWGSRSKKNAWRDVYLHAIATHCSWKRQSVKRTNWFYRQKEISKFRSAYFAAFKHEFTSGCVVSRPYTSIQKARGTKKNTSRVCKSEVDEGFICLGRGQLDTFSWVAISEDQSKDIRCCSLDQLCRRDTHARLQSFGFGGFYKVLSWMNGLPFIFVLKKWLLSSMI